MEITITKDITLKEVSDAFSSQLPHLKIEFFHHEHDSGEGSAITDEYAVDTKISEILTAKQDGYVVFDGKMKIGEFEQLVHDAFNLNVQIYRKSGNTWLQTINTDEWTLLEAEQVGVDMDH